MNTNELILSAGREMPSHSGWWAPIAAVSAAFMTLPLSDFPSLQLVDGARNRDPHLLLFAGLCLLAAGSASAVLRTGSTKRFFGMTLILIIALPCIAGLLVQLLAQARAPDLMYAVSREDRERVFTVVLMSAAGYGWAGALLTTVLAGAAGAVLVAHGGEVPKQGAARFVAPAIATLLAIGEMLVAVKTGPASNWIGFVAGGLVFFLLLWAAVVRGARTGTGTLLMLLAGVALAAGAMSCISRGFSSEMQSIPYQTDLWDFVRTNARELQRTAWRLLWLSTLSMLIVAFGLRFESAPRRSVSVGLAIGLGVAIVLGSVRVRAAADAYLDQTGHVRAELLSGPSFWDEPTDAPTDEP